MRVPAAFLGPLDRALGSSRGPVELGPAVAGIVDDDLDHEVAAQRLGQGLDVREDVGARD